MTDCALCGAAASYLEQLAHDWRFCGCCGRCYRVDAEGQIVTAATNHAPQRRIERDIAVVIVTDE